MVHSRVTVHADNYAKNLAALRQHGPPGWAQCPVLKADGYGHGTRTLARAALGPAGCEYIGVVDNWEAVDVLLAARECGRALRDAGADPVRGPPPARVLRVRPCSTTDSSSLREALDAQSLNSEEHLSLVEECVSSVADARRVSLGEGSPVRYVHLDIDCGMGRSGTYAETGAEIARLARDVQSACSDLVVGGIMTHLPAADEDPARTSAALDRFVSLVEEALSDALAATWAHPSLLSGERALLVHFSNSPTLLRYGAGLPTVPCAGPVPVRFMTRPGIATYGSDTVAEGTGGCEDRPRLGPTMSWHAEIISVRDAPIGSNVGYGATRVGGTADAGGPPRTLATVGVGYADGYFRSLSNRARATIRGTSVPQVGRVMMDMVVFDVTDVAGGVQVGEWLELLGPGYTADEMADDAGTISYEVLINIGQARNPDTEWVVVTDAA